MDGSEQIQNPWKVENLDEYLYYVCPECDHKSKTKYLFIDHACEQHPNAKECLSKVKVEPMVITNDSLEVKLEPNQEQFQEQFQEPEDFMVYDDGMPFDHSDWIGHEALDEDDLEMSQALESSRALEALESIEDENMEPAKKKLRKKVRRGRPIPALGKIM